jgi:serine/threonine protein kinase/Tol biopolymer transport system component
MSLGAGTRLGPYEVLGPIGAGGMGEVYRARDARLEREVALKVLPADLLSDEGRRRRFVQEARAASSLNHPHIITIHEIETAGDHDFIVMEYVRGKSLDALIPRQGMRLGDVLRIAIPVADALAAAHARGIIHRDLKPANVVVGTDGAVKVLDFGLAKLIGNADPADGDTATVTAQAGLSAPGAVAGTAAYMAPEQATGGAVDARSDIFAFGAMLYEMVTGERAFVGTSTADILTAVIRAQPKPPGAIGRDVPTDLEKLILRCLRKDPERRFQHIVDVKVALQDIKEESDSGSGAPAPVRRRRRTRLIALVATTLVLMSVAGAWLLVRSHRQVDVPPPRVVPLTALLGQESHPTFAPDGEQVAFAWNGPKQDNWDIYVTLVGSSDVRRLTSDPAADTHPTWSPDGRQIAFLRQRPGGSTIQAVSPLGGAERKLSDFRGAGSLSWSADSQWLAAGRQDEEGGQPRGIYLIPIDGGDPRLLIASAKGVSDSQPAFSPDGRRIAYASCDYVNRSESVHAGCNVSLVGLSEAASSSAPPRRLTTQRSWAIFSIAWTADGNSLLYAAETAEAPLHLWRVRVDGTQPAERLDVAGPYARDPAIASSRNRMAFSRVLADADIYQVAFGRPAQLILGSTFVEAQPHLSPDGQRLVFTSGRFNARGLWLAQANGSNPHQLTRGPGIAQASASWSPDGRQIAFDSFTDDLHFHVWVIDADGGTPRRVTTEPGNQSMPTWSHDGRSIYYSTGLDIWRISATGGTPERLTHGASGPFACESTDGKSLLYQLADDDSPLMTTSLRGGTTRQLVPCVKVGAFGVGPQGVYYVACDVRSDPLYVLDLESGRERRIGTLENLRRRPNGLSVSRDGRTIVYSKVTSQNDDLMLVENFR